MRARNDALLGCDQALLGTTNVVEISEEKKFSVVR